MAAKTRVQMIYPSHGKRFVAISPRTLGKRTRFYHAPSQASIGRLHKVVQELVHSGRWRCSPEAYGGSDSSTYDTGWIAEPFTW